MNVLSIQSHVAYGHVGQSAAVFPLQRLGIEVWALHTVSYSNHPGHGAFRGTTTDGGTLRDLVAGLESLGVLPDCDAVLSGYFGTVDTAAAALDAVARVRAANEHAIYCCDPVIGDTETGSFVPAGVADVIRGSAVPIADIVTPNRFELEILTGIKPVSPKASLDACELLRHRGPRAVLATGLTYEVDKIAALLVTDDGAWIATTPRIRFAHRPDGAGDLFAALFIGNLLGHPDPRRALARAISSTYAVLESTRDANTRELQIIQAQSEIATPTHTFAVESLG